VQNFGIVTVFSSGQDHNKSGSGRLVGTAEILQLPARIAAAPCASPLCHNGCEQPQQRSELFDYLIGALQDRRRNCNT